MINYCNENEVIEKIINYMNGASWKESGLEEFYNGEYFNEDSVIDNLYWCNLAGEVTDPESLREWLKNTNEGWNSAYNDLSEKGTDYNIRSNDIAKLSQAVYELNEVKGLLPYQELLDTVDLSKYKEKDWENYKSIDRRNLEYMSLEEAALYDYLLNTRGEEGANKYIEAMEDTINRREAAKNAIEYLDGLAEKGFDWTDIIASGWDGTEEGVIRFFDGLKNFFAADGKRSVSDYESMYKAQFLLQGSEEYGIDYSKIFTEGEKTFLNMNHQTWSSVGNMLIPSLVGLIPVVGKYASSGLMFMSIAGNSTESALQEGYGNIQSRLYGLTTGISETLTERLLGGIPGVSNLGKSFLGNMVSEGLEEFTQEYIDAMVRNIVLKEHNDLASPDLLVQAVESGALGTLTSGILQGGNSVVTTTLNAGVSTVTNGKTNYTDLYNQVESNVAKYSAEKTMTDYLKANKTGTSSILGKLKLNNALKNISAVELSEVTNSFTEEDINSLKNDTSLDVEAKDKLYLAEKVKKVQKSSDLSFLEANLDTLQETATRDGRTLLEYAIDTKPGLITEEIIKPIKKVDGKLASKIEERISERNIKVSNVLQRTLNKVEEIALEGGNLATDENTDIASQKFAGSLKTALGTVIPKVTTSIKNALSLFVPVAMAEDGVVKQETSTTEDSITITPEEKSAMLKELNDILTENESDPKIVPHIIEAFRTTDTPGSIITLKGLLKIAKKNNMQNKFCFISDDKISTAWIGFNNAINIGSSYSDIKSVIFHEIGHALFTYTFGEFVKRDSSLYSDESIIKTAFLKDAFDTAQTTASEDGRLSKIMAEQIERYNAAKARIRNEVKEELENAKANNQSLGDSFDAQDMSNSKEEHKKFGFEEEIERRLVRFIRGNTEIPTFHDTACAIFQDTKQDLEGNQLEYKFGHHGGYFNSFEHRIQEIMAQYVTSKSMGNTSFFELIKTTFGENYSSSIERIYQKMVEYINTPSQVTKSDAEELPILSLVERLRIETESEQAYFRDNIYESLSDDAKARYNLAVLLKDKGVIKEDFYAGFIGEFANCSEEEISQFLNQTFSDDELGLTTVRKYLEAKNETLLHQLENIKDYDVISESDLKKLSVTELVNKKIIWSSELNQNYIFSSLKFKIEKVNMLKKLLNGDTSFLDSSFVLLSEILKEKVTDDGLTAEDYLRKNNPAMLQTIYDSIEITMDDIENCSILELSEKISSLSEEKKRNIMDESKSYNTEKTNPFHGASSYDRTNIEIATFLNGLNNGNLSDCLSVVNKWTLAEVITKDGTTLEQYLQENYPQVLDEILIKINKR